MTVEIQRLIQQMAKAQARSPQQEKSFEAGAEAVVKLIKEMGVEETILPAVRKEINESVPPPSLGAVLKGRWLLFHLMTEARNSLP